MKFGPKGVLFLSVAGFVALGAFVRSTWIAPRYQAHRARKIAERLDRDGKLREGDILLQKSRSRQSRAVEQATRSPWSHCGILARRGGRWEVVEAAATVRATPLGTWLGKGRDGRYAILRVRDSYRKLSESDRHGLAEAARSFEGAPYDSLFGWDDDRIYCSELVWKAYHRALGIGPGRIQKLSDFDLSATAVKSALARRYGDRIPLTDSVVAPESFRHDTLLETIAESP